MLGLVDEQDTKREVGLVTVAIGVPFEGPDLVIEAFQGAGTYPAPEPVEDGPPVGYAGLREPCQGVNS